MQAPPPANGAIYQAQTMRPLFEDRRARHIGDIITIHLVERNVAEKNTNAQTRRTSDLTTGVGLLVIAAYALVPLVAAAVVLRRRDA